MAENWETSRLDGKLPSQVSYVYNGLVCLQVKSVNVHKLSGDGVLVLKQDRTVSFSSQDGKQYRTRGEV